MTSTTANTLFNRIIFLKKKINKYQTKQLGQLVKDLYLKEYNKFPEKTVINLMSLTGEPLTRLVAVYPNEFLPKMDELIISYAAKQEKNNMYKKILARK